MSYLEKFKEQVDKKNIKCLLCGSTTFEWVEYYFEAGGSMLKYTFYCQTCKITVSGYIYQKGGEKWMKD